MLYSVLCYIMTTVFIILSCWPNLSVSNFILRCFMLCDVKGNKKKGQGQACMRQSFLMLPRSSSHPQAVQFERHPITALPCIYIRVLYSNSKTQIRMERGCFCQPSSWSQHTAKGSPPSPMGPRYHRSLTTWNIKWTHPSSPSSVTLVVAFIILSQLLGTPQSSLDPTD